MLPKGFGTTGYQPPQDPRVAQAQQTWQQQGQTAAGQQSYWNQNQQDSRSGYANFINQQQASPLALPAIQQAGFNPSQAQQLIASMTNAANLSQNMQSRAGSFSPSATRSFDTQSIKNFDSENLRGLNFDQLMNYDPSQYGGEFARGAFGEFEMNLRDQLEQLTNASAGGRMRTGWFDADRGRVVTDNAKNFSNALSRAAVDFSGQRLSAIQGASQLGFNRASEMDGNALRAQSLAAELGLRQANEADRMSLQAAMAGDDFALKQVAQANGMTEAALRAQLDLVRMDTQNSQFNAGQANDMARFGVTAGMDRDKMLGGWLSDLNTMDRRSQESAADRAAAWTSSNMDWARADREWDAQQSQNAFNNQMAQNEFNANQYQQNTYLWTNPVTGAQRRIPVGQKPPTVRY
jgi:hypothetical protein